MSTIIIGEPLSELDTTNVAGIALSQFCKHGVVAGSTGMGKTKTIQSMIEQLSAAGVPSLLVDFKGDTSTLSEVVPVTTLRLTDGSMSVSLSDFGAQLLGRMLTASDAQQATLDALFNFAVDNSIAMHEIRDMLSLLWSIQDKDSPRGFDFDMEYGTPAVGTIRRLKQGLSKLNRNGGKDFFRRSDFSVEALYRVDGEGNGVVTILDASDLDPEAMDMAGAAMLYLLRAVYAAAEEVGQVDVPRLGLFLDEAHLLFDANAHKDLVTSVTRTVKLIRSKGVGVWFGTQSLTDLPETVLEQATSRIQHRLNSGTPKQAAALRATARAFIENPLYDFVSALQTMPVGVAIVDSPAHDGSRPLPVVVRVNPPKSMIN